MLPGVACLSAAASRSAPFPHGSPWRRGQALKTPFPLSRPGPGLSPGKPATSPASQGCCSKSVNMSEIMKDKATRLAKNRGSISSMGSHEIRAKDFFGRNKDSVSTVSYMDEPGHHEDSLRPAIQMENTYQLGPTKYFPITAVNNILKDVVVSYLQEEQYEAELCRQMTKTISEVIKARIKDLMVPRYKIIVIIYIGQLGKQSMQIGSRCLWDTTSDTFSSYSFKNRSLFALANVYALYSE